MLMKIVFYYTISNMELILSQKCAEQRVWPAINIKESGTRKEHLLMEEDEADF